MSLAIKRLSTAEFDAQVLNGLIEYSRQVKTEYFQLPKYRRENMKRYRDPTFGGVENGWFRCTLTIALPHLTRAQRQRAADSLRRLAAANRISLELSASGRAAYFYLLCDDQVGRDSSPIDELADSAGDVVAVSE